MNLEKVASIQEIFPDWKLPSLDSFFKSLIKEQDKLIWMGVIQTSKDQSLLVIDSSKVKEQGKSKKKEPKATDLKPKPSQQYFEGALGSKKKKFEKKLCLYCEKGYHLEEHCMRKQLYEISILLKKYNISPTRAKKPDVKTSFTAWRGIYLHHWNGWWFHYQWNFFKDILIICFRPRS